MLVGTAVVQMNIRTIRKQFSYCILLRVQNHKCNSPFLNHFSLTPLHLHSYQASEGLTAACITCLTFRVSYLQASVSDATFPQCRQVEWRCNGKRMSTYLLSSVSRCNSDKLDKVSKSSMPRVTVKARLFYESWLLQLCFVTVPFPVSSSKLLAVEKGVDHQNSDLEHIYWRKNAIQRGNLGGRGVVQQLSFRHYGSLFGIGFRGGDRTLHRPWTKMTLTFPPRRLIT